MAGGTPNDCAQAMLQLIVLQNGVDASALFLHLHLLIAVIHHGAVGRRDALADRRRLAHHRQGIEYWFFWLTAVLSAVLLGIVMLHADDKRQRDAGRDTDLGKV